MKSCINSTCSAGAAEAALCHTMQEMLPLYELGPEDHPASVLDSYPDPVHISEALQFLIDAIFPGKMTSGPIDGGELGIFLMRRLTQAWRLLRPEVQRALPFRWMGEAARSEGIPDKCDIAKASEQIMLSFLERLPNIRKMVIEDVRAAYEGDPAALTYAEVQLAYPGLLAVVAHRIAHELHEIEVPIVPRIMSEWIHSRTGVDIHPGAHIGHGLFIDHATGVVIGETTRIGNHVKIYQGVTLGAKSFPLDANGHPVKHIQRHPTVEDEVIIYANATILGGDTVIGKGSTIGGNVFLTESVPADSFVAMKPSELRIIESKKKPSKETA